MSTRNRRESTRGARPPACGKSKPKPKPKAKSPPVTEALETAAAAADPADPVVPMDPVDPVDPVDPDFIPRDVFEQYYDFQHYGRENALMFFVHNRQYEKWGPWIMTHGNYAKALDAYIKPEDRV